VVVPDLALPEFNVSKLGTDPQPAQVAAELDLAAELLLLTTSVPAQEALRPLQVPTLTLAAMLV
jgi:hypothetical protein